MSESITNKRDKFNKIMKEWSDFYGDDKKALIRLLRKKDVTLQEIAEELKTSKQGLADYMRKNQI